MLAELNDALADAVEHHGLSVVRVEARARTASTGVVWTEDGLIVTAHHALEREDGIELGFADGTTARATLVGRDAATDLALLRADRTGLARGAWAESSALRVGHPVLALGRPGRSVRASLGIVHALGDEWRTPAGGRIERFIEPDMTLRPGFSGGPLVDLSGNVVGVMSAGLVRGHSLCVPSETVARVVERLLERGPVRLRLGLGTQPVRLTRALVEASGQSSGLLVVSLHPDGPAERAGLMLGDVLLALDGHRLSDPGDVEALLGEAAAVSLRLSRAGQVVEVEVTAG